MQAQILDEAVYISLCVNALGKDRNLSLPQPSYGWIVDQTEFFNLDMANGLREGKTLYST